MYHLASNLLLHLVHYLGKFECSSVQLFIHVSQLVLTLPVSSVQAEKSFLCLRGVKTYLRSTMSDQRLNSLCLLSIEREMADTLLSVMDKFSELKGQKLPLVL